jgi:hypothetical protein
MPLLDIKKQNNTVFSSNSASCCWSSIQSIVQQYKIFSFFPAIQPAAAGLQFNQLYFFFLSLHLTPQLPRASTFLSLLFNFSTFLLNPTSGPNFCSHYISILLSLSCCLSLSLRIVLSSSLHTHTSHFLSLKRFLSLTINLQ